MEEGATEAPQIFPKDINTEARGQFPSASFCFSRERRREQLANKRKVTDLNQFEFYIEEFIKKCETESMKPSDHNLRIFLNVSQSTLDRYYRGEKAGETYKGYDEALKNLISYREHLLTSVLDQKGSNVAGEERRIHRRTSNYQRRGNTYSQDRRSRRLGCI